MILKEVEVRVRIKTKGISLDSEDGRVNISITNSLFRNVAVEGIFLHNFQNSLIAKNYFDDKCNATALVAS